MDIQSQPSKHNKTVFVSRKTNPQIISMNVNFIGNLPSPFFLSLIKMCYLDIKQNLC